jgi:sugar O-acyltransferase (sialic acid O-acetyltransferase NeuD family)
MSRKQKLVILGTRRFAEEIADLVSDCAEFELTAFGENWDKSVAGGSLLGRPILWVDDLKALADTHMAVCAIGTTKRSLFVHQAEELGFRFATICHPTARVSRTVVLGPGTIVSAGSILAAHASCGSHVIVNRGVLLGHHSAVGDFVTISPGANIGGGVRIGNHSYVGMGAIILHDMEIGSGALIGAGSVVTRNVKDRVQVMGVPAKVVRRDISPH